MTLNTGADRVIVYRQGSLGDIVVSLPSLHLIARTYPNARRAMLTNAPVSSKAPSASAILGTSGPIHEFISYPVGSRSPIELSRAWKSVRRFRPDVAIYLMPPRIRQSVYRDALFLKSCGVKNIIGLPHGDLSVNLHDPESGFYEPESSRLARCIRVLGDARLNERSSWDLGISAEEAAIADRLLSGQQESRIICCGVGTKQPAKDWGPQNWKVLIEKLGAELGSHLLILVGAADEFELSERVSEGWPGRRLNLCGKARPREIAEVIRRAELFVGPDSGPMHLAAAVGTPVTSVFSGQSKPGIWYPFRNAEGVVYHQTECCGCRLEVCMVEQKKCIVSITPDEVLASAIRSWKQGQLPVRSGGI